MRATSFKETNSVLMAGNNPNTDQLPIAHAKHEDLPGVNVMVSKYKLTEEEVKRINETGEIWLLVMGSKHPPLMPTVFNPFTEHGYEPLPII
jgi:hypothetical protein